jgi:ribosome-binding factor A
MSRLDKITEAIRREVSLVLHNQIKDPRLGFVTVVRVEMSADLRYAKVFYSVLGSQEDYKRTKAALDSASGFIRRLIAERIDLKFAPEIIFREDHSGEYSVRIQEVLEQIKELGSNPAGEKDAKAKITTKLSLKPRLSPGRGKRGRKAKRG